MDGHIETDMVVNAALGTELEESANRLRWQEIVEAVKVPALNGL